MHGPARGSPAKQLPALERRPKELRSQLLTPFSIRDSHPDGAASFSAPVALRARTGAPRFLTRWRRPLAVSSQEPRSNVSKTCLSRQVTGSSWPLAIARARAKAGPAVNQVRWQTFHMRPQIGI